MIELTNLEIAEYCSLDEVSGEKKFYKEKKVEGFTGLYFRDENNFFAIYPSKNEPLMFFQGKNYKLTANLSISLLKQGKKRTFQIADYNIEINYTESPYIGLDVWSDEMDVDLFFLIAQRYKDKDFHDRYTL
ncbi:MAG: hypothetical protein FWC91_05390 [Defluviitaleaceae bacterium]|nr:hypothetical protein [Defluviitaleaceae bacterium]